MTKARNIADLGSNDVIETTATGVDVTGTVTADGLTVDGQGTFTTADNNAQVTLVSTDTDALVGPQLNLWRNSGTGTNGDLIGQITFTGEDTVGSTNTFASMYSVADQTNNGAEDGSLHFQTLINGVLEDRFEINDAGNSIFTGNVGLGTSSPATKLMLEHSNDGAVGGTIRIKDRDSQQVPGQLTGAIEFESEDATMPTSGVSTAIKSYVKSTAGGAYLTLSTTDQYTSTLDERMRIDSNGNVGIANSAPVTRLDIDGFITLRNSAYPSPTSGVFKDGFIGSNDGTLTYAVNGASNGAYGSHKFQVRKGDSSDAIDAMAIGATGRVTIGESDGSYTHNKGLSVVSDEVGSHVLDSAISVRGSGGDFYPLNFIGTAGTGFGLLAAFSPSTDYLMWQYRTANASNNVMSINAQGSVNVYGALSKGSGSFKIDHPLPEKADTHHLVHSFIEGPQADNIYRGKIELVDGFATVNIDENCGMTEGTFNALNREIQCFTTNESGWTQIKGSVNSNILTIEAQDNTCTDTVSWMVIGERKDIHMYDTEWTDENGKVVVEPLKTIETLETE